MDDELVLVEVVVNFDGLRRGWTGQVELTDRIQALVRRGYLRLLGHVVPDVIVPPLADPPPAAAETPGAVSPTETPAARLRRSRVKGKATTTPLEDSDGGSPGGVRLE